MKNIKLLISYDGTGLYGWQKTSFGPSVEEHLERALSQILQEPIYLQAASRTDAGVHAEGQVVNFKTQRNALDLKKLRRSVNCLISNQIIIQSAEEVPEDFHPTVNSLGKEYHYYLCNTDFQEPKHRLSSWHFPFSLDIEKLNQASSKLVGTHDFSSFCNALFLSKRDPHCTLTSLEVVALGKSRYCFKVKGNRFLFRMVRNIVGTLAHIGCGKLELSELPLLLKSPKRTSAGITAPSHGLHLMKVFYKEDQPI
jgi:tRNA pseudouridine38-40 synthase